MMLHEALEQAKQCACLLRSCDAVQDARHKEEMVTLEYATALQAVSGELREAKTVLMCRLHSLGCVSHQEERSAFRALRCEIADQQRAIHELRETNTVRPNP